METQTPMFAFTTAQQWPSAQNPTSLKFSTSAKLVAVIYTLYILNQISMFLTTISDEVSNIVLQFSCRWSVVARETGGSIVKMIPAVLIEAVEVAALVFLIILGCAILYYQVYSPSSRLWARFSDCPVQAMRDFHPKPAYELPSWVEGLNEWCQKQESNRIRARQLEIQRAADKESERRYQEIIASMRRKEEKKAQHRKLLQEQAAAKELANKPRPAYSAPLVKRETPTEYLERIVAEYRHQESVVKATKTYAEEVAQQKRQWPLAPRVPLAPIVVVVDREAERLQRMSKLADAIRQEIISGFLKLPLSRRQEDWGGISSFSVSLEDLPEVFWRGFGETFLFEEVPNNQEKLASEIKNALKLAILTVPLSKLRSFWKAPVESMEMDLEQLPQFFQIYFGEEFQFEEEKAPEVLSVAPVAKARPQLTVETNIDPVTEEIRAPPQVTVETNTASVSQVDPAQPQAVVEANIVPIPEVSTVQPQTNMETSIDPLALQLVTSRDSTSQSTTATDPLLATPPAPPVVEVVTTASAENATPPSTYKNRSVRRRTENAGESSVRNSMMQSVATTQEVPIAAPVTTTIPFSFNPVVASSSSVALGGQQTAMAASATPEVLSAVPAPTTFSFSFTPTPVAGSSVVPTVVPITLSRPRQAKKQREEERAENAEFQRKRHARQIQKEEESRLVVEECKRLATLLSAGGPGDVEASAVEDEL